MLSIMDVSSTTPVLDGWHLLVLVVFALAGIAVIVTFVWWLVRSATLSALRKHSAEQESAVSGPVGNS
jgi:Tfp pilus assembly protein PilO